jgi:hypothetical protein
MAVHPGVPAPCPLDDAPEELPEEEAPDDVPDELPDDDPPEEPVAVQPSATLHDTANPSDLTLISGIETPHLACRIGLTLDRIHRLQGDTHGVDDRLLHVRPDSVPAAHDVKRYRDVPTLHAHFFENTGGQVALRRDEWTIDELPRAAHRARVAHGEERGKVPEAELVQALRKGSRVHVGWIRRRTE